MRFTIRSKTLVIEGQPLPYQLEKDIGKMIYCILVEFVIQWDAHFSKIEDPNYLALLMEVFFLFAGLFI